MHLTSIPRHRLHITAGDYARILGALIAPRRNAREIAAFEREFAAYVGRRHAIAVSSGRLGIHLLLEAMNFAPGDEVIVPAFNLFAVIERFCQFGMTPRFADIRRGDLNVDADDVERLITPRTKMLLATHMFGHPADMDALTRIAERHNLVVLEDCAHALGSRIGDRQVGTFGRAAIYSFSVLKLLTTFGGGMIVTDDDALATAIRDRLERLFEGRTGSGAWRAAVTGAVMDFSTRESVFSFGAWPALRLLRWFKGDIQQQMMTEQPHLDRSLNPASSRAFHPFQAVLGRSQLTKVDELIARRQAVGKMLDHALAGVNEIRPLASQFGGAWNGLYYGVLAERAADLCENLFSHGIDAETSEYRNCADLEFYNSLRRDCPVAREVESRIIRIPNIPPLTEHDVSRIARTIRHFYSLNEAHEKSTVRIAASGA
ncbi:MAG: aminotransferase class I/II-fold pyridoxal phosphate-dependent enzyme [Planctomycetes bacterium]|nr:aminotransferase class I/II-fold pyridoxal phosphate-dependent enzyme [Planctomycetota bacterium]MBI3833942.1 aminotransferase class I/II-fold pyridoxal phosphate-dependent enzyme [Planctomycetota bacterium]